MLQRRINISETNRRRQGLDRKRTNGIDAPHELKYGTRAPWESKRTLEYVSEQYVIG